MIHRLPLVVALITSCRHAQGVRSDAVLLGGTAVLPCDFSQSTEDHAQISWQRKTKAKPLVDNFFVIESATKHNYVNGGDDRFKFIGDFPKKDGTLQLSNVTLMDEGRYTCIFTFFSGNLRKEVSLAVYVPPSTSLKAEEIFEGVEEVPLASCVARGAKPRALVRWDTTNIQETLRSTNSTTPHENGTVTTVSSLFGIPTQNITARPVRCIITTEALTEELVLPLTLQINFPPLNTLISERSDDFECISEANPSASITWRKHSSPNSLRKELSLSKPVSAEAATLSFLKKKSDLQGLFECEAKNRYGSQTAYLYVHLHSGSCCKAGWVLFGILLAINLLVVVWKYYPSCKRRLLDLRNRQEVPSNEGGSPENHSLGQA